MSNRWSRGSEWHRWDVHIHTPGTALADEYPADSWETYVARINDAAPQVIALGVTDYLSLRGYKELRARWVKGELPNVRLIFPNIEFRISPPTKKHKGVNVHLLVDPTEDEHIEKVEAALTRLTFEYDGEVFNCDHSGIGRFGRKLDPRQVDPERAYRTGVNEFKIDFSRFRDWRREDRWLQEHCLVAVSNNEHDGVSGLSKEHGYSATMEEMFRLADIVFSGNPADRKYWLGDAVDGVEALTKRFGGQKPCLHGSDAHELDRVLAPDEDRFCWIRAEPTFDGLRQVVFEPRGRVAIGPDQPSRSRRNWIRSISVQGQPWFPSHAVELNEGLVAIIGPRGSGKTALADLIAHAADGYEAAPASFLGKATKETAGTTLEIQWADQEDPQTRTVGADPEGYPAVRYLSQHFVEQLCSAQGASERLVGEVETVIFEALDETDRSDASSFDELRHLVTRASLGRMRDLRTDIAQASEEIAREVSSMAELSKKRERLGKVDIELAEFKKSLGGLVVKGKEEKAQTLDRLRAEVERIENVVADLKKKERRLEELRLDLEQQERLSVERYERGKAELLALGISEGDVPAFRLRFGGDVDGILARRLGTLRADLAVQAEGSTPARASERPLKLAKKELEAIQKEIGGDSVRERQLLELQGKQKARMQERTNLEAEIKRIEQADARIKEAQQRRLENYVHVFAELQRQREALAKLYEPLRARLAEATPERRRLEFVARQVADVETWASRGEELLDLRRKGIFQERGSLARKAEELLGEAWRTSNPDQVRNGMLAFLDLFKDVSSLLVPTASLANFAEWLFSTEHVRITYGILYDGTNLEHLSPGQRGIVLLILYLALDTQDDRPLVVDQPEENLDPQSIFEVLSGYFRDIRARRQVLVVTHNPNLVVNTDSDQVIVAASERVPGEALPRMTYEAGGLENRRVRKRTCQILEGGEDAFLQRERRYALHRTI